MAQIAPAAPAARPAVVAPAGPGLFGTGCWIPIEALVSADPRGTVEPPRVPATRPPAPSRRRGPGRRMATWGAGPDGAHLAWRATPLRVHRLGAGQAPAARTAAAAPRPPPAAAAVPPPARAPVDAELEAAVAFATDFTVDLLRTPARLAGPAPRRT